LPTKSSFLFQTFQRQASIATAALEQFDNVSPPNLSAADYQSISADIASIFLNGHAEHVGVFR